jgi:hypothetical protein
MLKKLTAKIQQLNPTLTESVAGFSKCLVIEPETNELLLKKGSIYTVFEISGNTHFEVNLITNVVHDVLHDSYYQSDNISPIQSLEKAITEVRDKVIQLANESIIIDKQVVDFKILAGVLWGNVMYVVQLGEAKSYLMRTGEIRPINTMSEGSFSAASGVVKDDDVIIFCTSEFAKDFPPDRLLSISIPESNLTEKQACLLMKFIIDTSFTDNEVVDFGLEDAGIKNESKTHFFTKFVLGIGDKIHKVIASRITNSKPHTPSIKLKSEKAFKFKFYYLIPLVVVAFAISIVLTLKNNKNKPPEKNKPLPTPQVEITPQTSDTSQNVEASKAAVTDTTDTTEDKQFFYDLKMTNSQVNPLNIAVFNTKVVVTDKDSGNIYISDRETPKFVTEPKTFPGITNAININGKLGFTDTKGYEVYDLTKSDTSESYSSSDLGVTSAYSDFIYSIKDNVLSRYTKDTDKLTSSVWGENVDFGNTRSFAVAYSLYLVKNDGTIAKYTSGNKDTFNLTGDTKQLNTPLQILADIDFDNIYVADKGNQRVVSYTKNGAFVKEYTSTTPGKWDDLKSIGISPDEKTLYVLAGTTVYEIAL